MKQCGEIELGRNRVEVLGFRGVDGFAFLLVDPAKRDTVRIHDAHYPWPDHGYIWLREIEGTWLASGKVDARLVGDSSDALDILLYFITEEMLGVDDQVSSLLELTNVTVTHVASNEDDLVFEGPRR